jgi:aquaporin TIP
MKDSWRHFIAEFVGTFALVFVGGAAIIVTTASGSPSLLAVALAHGLILSIMVTALMRVSGHFNPAVTLAFLSVGRIEAMMAGLYIVAQLTGALAAAYLLCVAMPADAGAAVNYGGQSLSPSVSYGAGVALETVATFFLVFVIFGTAVDPKAPRVGGFAIGLAVAANILAIGPITGASMNPARSFGPAVVSKAFEGHAIYWIGPIVGAILAAQLYQRVFIQREPEPADHGTIRP